MKKVYRLRNGITVQAGGLWSVKILSVPEEYDGYFKVGRMVALMINDDCSEDPLTWTGGIHGKDYDVIEEVKNDK